MAILLGFLPFLAFAALSLWQGAFIALIAGAAVSAGLLIRNHARGHSPKILEAGTLVLFLALAIYAGSVSRELSIIAVRLYVDLGLLAIILISMSVRHPFTLQYAKEQVAPEHWSSPLFIRTNYAITAGWAFAFVVMVIAEAAMLIMPDLPKTLGTIVIVGALLGGVYYTKRRTQAAHTSG